MTVIGQVKTAVVNALQDAGLAAADAYSEEQLKKYTTAVTAVGLREMRTTESGAMEYLGQRYDAVRGTELEVYGRRMEILLSLDVYAPRTLRAAACEEAEETITQILLSSLPNGLRVKELSWGQTEWDKTYGMFHLDAEAKFEAYLTAETAEETVVFTDFILRGVVQEDE